MKYIFGIHMEDIMGNKESIELLRERSTEIHNEPVWLERETAAVDGARRFYGRQRTVNWDGGGRYIGK